MRNLEYTCFKPLANKDVLTKLHKPILLKEQGCYHPEKCLECQVAEWMNTLTQL